MVQADEAKLNQILMNLLGNAVKFTQEGEIVLTVEALPDDQYRFEVRDTGLGISPQEQATLFTPFQQGQAGRQYGGTGLGLSISQCIVELMGGAMSLESTLGAGTRFTFTVSLPPAGEGAADAADSAWIDVERLATGTQLKVVVADDVAENRTILASLLTELGAEVVLAEDGQQALDQIEATEPDIAFIDIRMPSLDGEQTLRHLRADTRWQNLKIVAVSASVLEHQRQHYLESGFDAFVPKPFRFEQICAVLADLLAVEFVYRDDRAGSTDEDPQPTDQADWSQAALPAELLAELRQAAELYDVTNLERHLQAVEQLADPAPQLAAHLRSLRQQLDMDGILAALETIGRNENGRA